MDGYMLCRLEHLLTPEELSKANRYLRPADRLRFIVSRGMLRVLLAQYLEMEPGDIAILTGKNGKPHVQRQGEGTRIGFNVSHSRNGIVYAFIEEGEIGIDVEDVSQLPDLDKIIPYVFSDQEMLEFKSLPEDMKVDAFFTCWTRKEAYIKARGVGLGIPLQQINTSFLSASPQLICDSTAEGDDALWYVNNIFTFPGYCMAVAVNQRFSHFDYYYWPQDRAFLKDVLDYREGLREKAMPREALI
jgi:4'-phosphopantetheinyl transferase